MKTTIKNQVIEINKKYNDFQDELKKYNNSFWFRMFNDRPRFIHRYFATLYRNDNVCIELRILFYDDEKRVFISVNENQKGYNYNIASGEKDALINAKNKEVSQETEKRIKEFAKEYSFLIK